MIIAKLLVDIVAYLFATRAYTGQHRYRTTLGDFGTI